MKRANSAVGVKADGYGGRIYHAYIKRQKNRLERRRARRQPDCVSGYGRYNGWES